jgi:hypothetical protein
MADVVCLRRALAEHAFPYGVAAPSGVAAATMATLAQAASAG